MILMSAISDIRHRHLLFRYRKCSDINLRVHSDIRYLQKNFTPTGFEPAPLKTITERCTIYLLYNTSTCTAISDTGYRTILYFISDIMSDIALSVRCRRFRYQAQSDIADHGYRTKCPPMIITTLEGRGHFFVNGQYLARLSKEPVFLV